MIPTQPRKTTIYSKRFSSAFCNVKVILNVEYIKPHFTAHILGVKKCRFSPTSGPRSSGTQLLLSSSSQLSRKKWWLLQLKLPPLVAPDANPAHCVNSAIGQCRGALCWMLPLRKLPGKIWKSYEQSFRFQRPIIPLRREPWWWWPRGQKVSTLTPSTWQSVPSGWSRGRIIWHNIPWWWWCFPYRQTDRPYKPRENCVHNDSGELTLTDEGKMKAWPEHYARLLNVEFEWPSNELHEVPPYRLPHLQVCPRPWFAKHSAKWNATRLLTHLTVWLRCWKLLVWQGVSWRDNSQESVVSAEAWLWIVY